MSARSMMIVLTLGMSMPFSMIVVETRTWKPPWMKRCMMSSSSEESSLPWAVSTRTSGTVCWRKVWISWRLSMRLWR